MIAAVIELAQQKAPPETWAILRHYKLIDEKGRLLPWIEEIQTTPHGIIVVGKDQNKWAEDGAHLRARLEHALAE